MYSLFLFNNQDYSFDKNLIELEKIFFYIKKNYYLQPFTTSDCFYESTIRFNQYEKK